jgi:hypothetical protein
MPDRQLLLSDVGMEQRGVLVRVRRAAMQLVIL